MQRAVAIGCAMLMLGVLANGGMAQSPDQPPLARVLLERLSQRADYEAYVSSFINEISRADRDADGLDKEDVDFAIAAREAQLRTDAISTVLTYDYDGDLRVSRAELDHAPVGRPFSSRNDPIRLLGMNDVDGDDVITLAEVAATAIKSDGKEPTLRALLALDPDRDGKLQTGEMRRLAQAAFERVDRDGNGVLSPTELAPFLDR